MAKNPDFGAILSFAGPGGYGAEQEGDLIVPRWWQKPDLYDADGNPYPLPHTQETPLGKIVWRVNHVFRDRFKVIGLAIKGRSKNVVMQSTQTGIEHPMFVPDLLDIVMGEGFEKGGEIEGYFSFRKRGQVWALWYLGKEDLWANTTSSLTTQSASE